MNGNLRVGNLFGIPFFINISWFFVLALTTLNFGSGLATQFPWLGGGSLILGLIAGILLFVSVVHVFDVFSFAADHVPKGDPVRVRYGRFRTRGTTDVG